MLVPAIYGRIRLNHTLFIAIAVHACVILALGFSWSQKPKAVNSLEVTLAQFQSLEPNPDADFFAQMNQQGSGDSEQVKKLSDAPQTASLSEQLQNRTADGSQQSSPSQPENSSSKQAFKKDISTFDIVSTHDSDFDMNIRKLDLSKLADSQNPHNNNISNKIVALKHQINLRRQQIAKAPKKRVISSMSTKSHQDAAYLENWRRRIVSVGNIHYPKAANEQKLYGRVRLLIAMRADGNVKSIEILESSQKKILDQAAVKIIRLSAPFEPFSQEMRKNTDILEIIRTIEFEKSTQIY